MRDPDCDCDDDLDWLYARASMSWCGWGSPVGLAVLIASLGFFLLCLHRAGLLD